MDYSKDIKDYHFFFKYELSQWFKRDVVYIISPGPFNQTQFPLAQKFNCCEQLMMVHKALLFDDKDNANLIMQSTSPKEQKALGRQVKNFNQVLWDEVKNYVVEEINYSKFAQHQDLKDLLLSTDSKIIVECSKYDRIWGIGFYESDSEVQNLETDKWGENLLGQALMRVRERLKSNC